MPSPHNKSLNGEIARLTLPNIISNITVPFMGMADIAIAGFIGGDVAIGGITIGTTIFNMIYRNCSFLRMSGSGVTAQKYGAGNTEECIATLARLLAIALSISLLLLVVKDPLCRLSLDLIGGSESTVSAAWLYVRARFWAVPASISLFALNGWFIGMQKPQIPMLIAIISNVVNICASFALAVWGGMGIEGVAYGTVIAQYTGLCVAISAILMRFPTLPSLISWEVVWRKTELSRLFSVNRDIFLRTLCLTIVFTSFTAISARYGDQVLAANALILQFFTLFSYMIDGLAFAAESLIGRLVGSGGFSTLNAAVKKITVAGFITATLYTIVFTVSWRAIFNCFSPSPETIEEAALNIGWAIAMPFCCFFAFIADGIMVGATKSAAMRNTMACSTALFFATYFMARNAMGAHALWLAFLVYMLARGVLLLPQVRALGKKI